MDATLLKAIGTVVAIILVDLALSGDNALVIGSVASKLEGKQRRNAITVGGLIAIVLRIALTFLAVFLLQIPFISIVGGIAVFVIAVQLIRDIDTSKQEETDIEQAAQSKRVLPSNATFLSAITTIAIADFSMSLDNALAIAALARTNYLLLVLGLLFSITVLLLASTIVARLIARFPLLMYVSGLILAITAGTMVLEDSRLKPVIEQWDKHISGPPVYYLLLGAVVVLFAGIAYLFRNHTQAASKTA
ncbi:MAG: YjbE family putative metal transport protein [Ktedonobacterales bacterium]|nr:YjbE family putative metal transport protein [Ktedonobacterales bacterium]